jgi:hypothetical protein
LQEAAEWSSIPLVGEDGRQDAGGHSTTERVSVSEAARILETTVDALRKRVQRDSIAHEKDEDGRVWILLDTGRTRQAADQDTAGHRPDALLDAKDETISELRARVVSLEHSLEEERDARRRADTIIAQLTARIPELEPPREAPSEVAEETMEPTPSEPSGGPQEPVRRRARSWWKRYFGASMVGLLTALSFLHASGEQLPFPSPWGAEPQGLEQATATKSPTRIEQGVAPTPPQALPPAPAPEVAPAPTETSPHAPAPEPAPIPPVLEAPKPVAEEPVPAPTD